MKAARAKITALQFRASGKSRQSEEDIISPRQNQDPSPRRDTPTPTETENPPNENLHKDPDEAYGDTEIPGRTLRPH